MKVVKMLMVAFDLTNNEQLEMLAEMQDFESEARDNSMLVDSALQGSDAAPAAKVTEPATEAKKAAPARRAAAPKKEEVKLEGPEGTQGHADPAGVEVKEAVKNEQHDARGPKGEAGVAGVEKTEQTADDVGTFNQDVTIEQIRTQISKIATDYGHPEREERVKAAKALMAKFNTKEGTPVSKSTELQESDYPAFYTELVKI